MKSHEPCQNRLLAALPTFQFERIRPELELVSLNRGQTLHEPGGKMDHVYFPTTAMIALLYLAESGASTEVGVVGNEGILGIELFMGGDSSTNLAVVERAGGAFRMKANSLKAEFAMGSELQLALLRYTQALLTQISQTAVCNRIHSVSQQLARLLLLSRDCSESDRMVMTQEQVAHMMGIRRESVSKAAASLARMSLIETDRGTIKILDRAGLESATCECYGVVFAEYDRLLGRANSR